MILQFSWKIHIIYPCIKERLGMRYMWHRNPRFWIGSCNVLQLQQRGSKAKEIRQQDRNSAILTQGIRWQISSSYFQSAGKKIRVLNFQGALKHFRSTISSCNMHNLKIYKKLWHAAVQVNIKPPNQCFSRKQKRNLQPSSETSYFHRRHFRVGLHFICAKK